MVTGKVVKGGKPLEGAYVRLLDKTEDFVSERRTRADGAFKFNVSDGEWQIVAFAPDTERVTLAVNGTEEDLTIELGGE